MAWKKPQKPQGEGIPQGKEVGKGEEPRAPHPHIPTLPPAAPALVFLGIPGTGAAPGPVRTRSAPELSRDFPADPNKPAWPQPLPATSSHSFLCFSLLQVFLSLFHVIFSLFRVVFPCSSFVFLPSPGFSPSSSFLFLLAPTFFFFNLQYFPPSPYILSPLDFFSYPCFSFFSSFLPFFFFPFSRVFSLPAPQLFPFSQLFFPFSNSSPPHSPNPPGVQKTPNF